MTIITVNGKRIPKEDIPKYKITNENVKKIVVENLTKK